MIFTDDSDSGKEVIVKDTRRKHCELFNNILKKLSSTWPKCILHTFQNVLDTQKNRDIKNWLFTKCIKLPLWFGLDQRCFDLSQMSLWFSNYYYKKMLIIIQWCLWTYEQEVGTHYLFYKLKKTGPSGENTWVLFAYILSMCVYEKSC